MDMLELRGNRLIVHLPAELDHHHTEEIRKEIDRTVEKKMIDKVEFDFSQTVFMDSAGIGMLLGRYKIMRALGGKITVSHMSGQIYRVLSLSGIQRYIELEREEAV